MYYFFDESGNWQEFENERKKLVIGGVVIEKKDVLNDLRFELDSFRHKHSLKEIHTTDLDMAQREEFSILVEKYLKRDDVRALAYVIDPKSLNQTKTDEDEIYINFASELISNLIFYDKDPVIEYDMKFYYSYPSFVLDAMKDDSNIDFEKMKRKFLLKEDSIKKERDRIKTSILRRIKNFDVDKLYNVKFLNDYIWTEFRLNIQKSYLLRGKLEDRVEQDIKRLCEKIGIEDYGVNVNIKYQHKYKYSVGIELADNINNIVYNNLPLKKYIEIREL